MKTKNPLPADPAFHRCVAAYCSDHHLLWTTLRPHAVTAWTNPSLALLVSLDHSMWFHSDFKADEWLLYEMESPRVAANRGLALGRLWTPNGTLVMSCAQEGLIRTKMHLEKPLTTPSSEYGDEMEKKANEAVVSIDTNNGAGPTAEAASKKSSLQSKL
jgi:acyl-CoA thioesterase 8